MSGIWPFSEFQTAANRTRRGCFGAEGFLAAKNHVTGHTIFEFADIPGPIRILKQLQQFTRGKRRTALESRIKLRQEMFDKPGNIFAPVAQPREMHADHVDAVEKVGAESPGFDFIFQTAIRRANHARFDFLFFLIADRGELSVLQHLQKLGLQRRIQFADFIQEKRAAIGQLDSPGLGVVSSGKRALLISEKFALQAACRESPRNSLSQTAPSVLGER